MSKVSRLSDLRTVTAELNVEYLKPVPVDAEIIVEGFEVRRDGRQSIMKGRSGPGRRPLALGRGRFVVVDLERYARQQARTQEARSADGSE